ncbi:MAG: hypothetical protein HQK75_00975 [Candidatus Magnetomorum sp.]|nr:hypothetical protein [Candidatus Magnetomorum sp.]
MISKCINLQTISAYLGGRLNDQAVSDIEAHLAACYRCREQVVFSQDILLDPDLTTDNRLSETEASTIMEQLHLSPTFIQTCKAGIHSFRQYIQKHWQSLKDQWSPGLSSPLAFSPVRVRSSAQPNSPLKRLNIPFQNHHIDCIIVPVDEDCCQLSLKVFYEKRRVQNCRITLVDSKGRTASRLAETGEILFENIPWGDCQLNVFHDGTTVGETKIYTGSFGQ